jgi:putative ABC transport system permease protein
MSKNRIPFLAELRESFLMAMSAISAHKLRSALTLLGVLIGVFSIIVVMTAIRAMESNIDREISSLGSQTFMISKWPAFYFGGSGGDFQKYWRRKDITMAQGKRLQDKTSLAAFIGMESQLWSGSITTRYKSSAPDVELFGETPGSFPAHNWTPGEGRVLIDADVDSARNVCVLGAGLAQNIFPTSSPVGDRVKIDGINYTVVGVLESQGGSLGGNQDNFAVIPLSTALNRYGRRSLSILVEAHDRDTYEATLEETRGALRVIRKVPPGQDDDFEIDSNDSMIAQFDSFTRDVRIGAAVISSIALLAAGIGIMNIMLVSVTERTREIGIRRAIGAKKRNVMVQFIMEAIVLCEVGGVAGVVLGILGGDAMAALLKLPPVIPFDWIGIGLTTCSIVGIIFGTYPAYKAANLDPIESLRYE